MVPAQMANVIKGLFIGYCQENNIRDIDVEIVALENSDIPCVRISNLNVDTDKECHLTVQVTKTYTDFVMSSIDNFTEAGKTLYPGFISACIKNVQKMSSM